MARSVRPPSAASPAAGDLGSGARPRASVSPPEAYRLGRYLVVNELGQGGMASVHLARVDGPGGFLRWCAIKQIHPYLAENPDIIDMFLDEARMAAMITHPNVAQILELGRTDDTYWLVMEYLHGEPLREIIRRQSEVGYPLPWHISAKLVADAAEGLHAAHEIRSTDGELLNLVHRDVTPHNIFVTYEGHVKLVDFGIAKAAGRLAQTGFGTLKGKIAYMSPEQAFEKGIDRRTDIYALGIVFWELLTNQRLFLRDNDIDTFVAVRDNLVPPPTQLVPGIPAELERIAMQALAKEPANRMQTARDFARAIETFLARTWGPVGAMEVEAYLRDAFAQRIAERNLGLHHATELTSMVDANEISRLSIEPLPPRDDLPTATEVDAISGQTGLPVIDRGTLSDEVPTTVSVSSGATTMSVDTAIASISSGATTRPVVNEADGAAVAHGLKLPANVDMPHRRSAQATTQPSRRLVKATAQGAGWPAYAFAAVGLLALVGAIAFLLRLWSG